MLLEPGRLLIKRSYFLYAGTTSLIFQQNGINEIDINLRWLAWLI